MALTAGIGAISSMSMAVSSKAVSLPLGWASWTLEKIAESFGNKVGSLG